MVIRAKKERPFFPRLPTRCNSASNLGQTLAPTVINVVIEVYFLEQATFLWHRIVDTHIHIDIRKILPSQSIGTGCIAAPSVKETNPSKQPDQTKQSKNKEAI